MPILQDGFKFNVVSDFSCVNNFNITLSINFKFRVNLNKKKKILSHAADKHKKCPMIDAQI